LRIVLAAQLRKCDPVTTTAVMRDAVGQLDSEIAKLRSLITELRPAALDDLGVEAAIEHLAELARRDGLDVALMIDLGSEEAKRQGPELETALYRITQEALTNARKHGGASSAQVEIRAGDGCLHVSVCDDGNGFDSHAETDGFGLHSMHERTELLGGTLNIKSTPGRGTQIAADFPRRPASSKLRIVR
jgi:signal transduction histidine kinase